MQFLIQILILVVNFDKIKVSHFIFYTCNFFIMIFILQIFFLCFFLTFEIV